MSINQALFWAAHGTTIDKVRAVKGGSASEIRAAWDYRAEGLTIDAARKIISDHTRPASAGGHQGYLQRRIKSARKAFFSGGDKGAFFYSATSGGGKYLYMQRNKRAAAAAVAEKAAKSETPAAWLVAKLTWDNPYICLAIPGGCVLETSRHERAEWGRKNGHYPTKTEVTYTTTLHHASGDAKNAVKISHDCRGDWRTRVLSELALAIPQKTDMHIRLHPCCEIKQRHVCCDFKIGERLLVGRRVDFYAEKGGIAFHAETVREAAGGRVQVCGPRGESIGLWSSWAEFEKEIGA